ncbi:MAG: hypothetical protein ACKOCN_07145, partial [Planctomycetaceae bacterium]
RFHPRCGHARLKTPGAQGGPGAAAGLACDHDPPELLEARPGHFVRCHYWESVGPPVGTMRGHG